MKKIILLSVITLFSVCTMVQAKNYYIRMSTNTSDWSGITADATHVKVDYVAGADFAAIVNGYAVSDVVWVAKGTYTIAQPILLKSNMNMIGGFSGVETSSSLLTTRTTSDLDGNGIVEPWEFTNATEIVSANTSDLTTTFSAINFYDTSTGAIVDGITVKDIIINSTSTSVVYISYLASGCEFKNSIVKDCSVWSDSQDVNGAVRVDNGIVQNCLIQGNTSEATQNKSFGGGLQLNGGNGTNVSSPKVIGCVIRGNKSINTVAGNCRGGGAYVLANNATSYPRMINCLIYNNETQGQGGGLFFEGVNSEALNCTVANNKAALNGGGVFFLWYGIMNNSIVWGNLQWSQYPHDIYFGGDSSSIYSTDFLAYGYYDTTSNATFTLPALSSTILLTISNTIDGTDRVSPKFINPTSFAGVPSITDGGVQTAAMMHANFELGSTSPCIDYANNMLLTQLGVSTDLLGADRFVNSIADLGPYEYVATTGIHEIRFQYGIYASNQHIVLSDLPLGQMISIYNTAGQLVKNMKIDNSSMTVGISKGLYLVRIANSATKIIVQ